MIRQAQTSERSCASLVEVEEVEQTLIPTPRSEAQRPKEPVVKQAEAEQAPQPVSPKTNLSQGFVSQGSGNTLETPGRI